MAGIGEASAIISVVQVGFSLATALNSYIADVAYARDDISSLASDIEATFGQLRDLEKLIQKNETTKAWSEDGLRNAEKCVTDCGRIITKLRELLKKSTASLTSKEVNRDEIDVTKLERARWPFIKPKLEFRQRELQSIKQDIMIAYSSYMTQVGTDAERKKYADNLPGLQKTRRLVHKQLQEAKKQRQRQVSPRQRRPQSRPPVQVAPNVMSNDHAWQTNSQGVAYPLHDGPGINVSDDGRSSVLGNDEAIRFDNIDELEREFEIWKAQYEEREAEEGAEKRRLQEEAVETWKKRQVQEVEARQKRTEEERSSLRAELTKQRVAPQQIEDIVNHVHPQRAINYELSLVHSTTQSGNVPSIASSECAIETAKSYPLSIWSKTKLHLRRRSSTATPLSTETRITPVPELLQDAAAEGGIVPLEATYFRRPSGTAPVIQNFDVEIPGQWLLDSLIKREKAVAHDHKKVNSVWREFSHLPDDYQFAIGNYMRERACYSRGSERVSWVLLHLECMFKRRRHSFFDRESRKDIVGVYVVLKRNKSFRGRSLDDESSERKRYHEPDPIPFPNDNHGHHSMHLGHRPREGRGNYEPRHSSGFQTRELPDMHAPPHSSQDRDQQYHPSSTGPCNPSRSMSFAEPSRTGYSYPQQFSGSSLLLGPYARTLSDPAPPFRPYGQQHTGLPPLLGPYARRFSGLAPTSGPSFDNSNLPVPQQLSGISEEGFDPSISSDEAYDDKILRLARAQLRETDEQLLDETLKEYVNPDLLKAENGSVYGLSSPALGIREASGLATDSSIIAHPSTVLA